MVISVQGQLLDTRFIYSVSPITEVIKSGGAYSFEVLFLDDNRMSFRYTMYDVMDLESGSPRGTARRDARRYFDQEDVALYSQRVRDGIEAIRDFVVAHWKRGQSDIPSIDL